MKMLVSFLGTIAIVLCAFNTSAADNLASCPNLQDKNAYGEKYEDFVYIVPGKEGWFFRTKQDLRTDYAVSYSIAQIFKKFSDILEKKGTKLVIAFIPPRGMAGKKFLPSENRLIKDYSPEKAEKNYHDFIAYMNAQGIIMTGIENLQNGERFFYKADHHWSSAGAKAMAENLALRIKKLPIYDSLEKREFDLIQGKKVSFKGSLNKVLKALCGKEAPPETDTLTVTHERDKSADAVNLFEDKNFPEIVLIGTSNSKKENNDVNFEGYLKHYLSADIFNAAISGGGIDDPMLAYLVSDDYKKHKPKIIIWEIPGYYDLESKSARAFMQQAIPAIYGDCPDFSLAQSSAKISGKRVELMSNIGGKEISSDKSYIFLKFNHPMRKNFSLLISYKDGKKETFRFQRSKFYPYDGLYSFLPRISGLISDIDLEVPSAAHNWEVEGRLCSFPGNPHHLFEEVSK